MSPEQALGRDVDARSDLFSLGIMIHEMVTGRRPFTGSSPTEIIDQILHAEPPPLTGPAGAEDAVARLDRIADRCLAKDREHRYPSAAELLAELRSGEPPFGSRPASIVGPSAPENAEHARRDQNAESRRRVWEWDLVLAALFGPVLVYMAWFAHKLVTGSWGLASFYVVVLSVVLATILRATLLVMAVLQSEGLRREAGRLGSLTRALDLMTTASLLVLAMGLDMSSYIVTFVLLTGLAAAGLIRVTILHPLLMREAFPPAPTERI